MLFRAAQARAWLGLGEDSEWLYQAGCPIPKVDIRRPGGEKPVWRWRLADLEAFAAARLVRPGHSNPMD